jgi:tetratricopeptide (TPR) repeat protein
MILSMKILNFFGIVFLLCISANFATAQSGIDEYVKAEGLLKQKKYKEAVTEYDNAIQKDAKNYKFHFHKGKCLLILKEEDQAIKSFQKTVDLLSAANTSGQPEMQKDLVEANMRLARLFEKQKKVDEAVKAYDNAFKYETAAPNKLKYKLSILRLLKSSGRLAEAANHVNDAKQVAPDDLNVLYYEAKYGNEPGVANYAVAKAAMEKAITKLPSQEPKDVAKYYYELGYALTQLGEHDRAQNDILPKAKWGPYANKVLKLTPEYFHSIATSYYKIYELDKAKTLVEQALKIKKSFPRAHDLLVKIATGQTDRSAVIDHFKTSIETERDPTRRAYRFSELAEMELENRRYDDAIKSAEECLKASPKNYAVLFIKSVAQHKLNQTDAAIKTINDIMQIDGIDPESKAQYFFAQGVFYDKVGKKKEAVDAFKNANYGSFRYAAKEELDRLTNSREDEEEPGEAPSDDDK